MSRNALILGVVIVAACLILVLVGLPWRGPWEVVQIGKGSAYKLNTQTGEMLWCGGQICMPTWTE